MNFDEVLKNPVCGNALAACSRRRSRSMFGSCKLEPVKERNPMTTKDARWLMASLLILCAILCGCSGSATMAAEAASDSHPTNRGKKQILQGAHGVSMPATAFAAEATEPLRIGMTADQFKARLANGGTISLD